MTTIMLVNDDELIRKSVGRELKIDDFEVIAVSSGRACIKKLKTTCPDPSWIL